MERHQTLGSHLPPPTSLLVFSKVRSLSLLIFHAAGCRIGKQQADGAGGEQGERRGSRPGWPGPGGRRERAAGRLQCAALPGLAGASLVTSVRARGYVMESQSFQCKLQLLLLLPLMPVTHIRGWARNGEEIFLMLTVVGIWKRERPEEGDSWRRPPTTRLTRGGGA